MKLHDMSEEQRGAAWADLGFVAYCRQWRAEQREQADADRGTKTDNVRVARAGEASLEVKP